MHPQNINRVSEIAPIVLSLLAFSVVIVAVATRWDKGYADEGPAAHIFQLLIVAEVPFLLAFIATADLKRVVRVAGVVGLQAAALVLALSPVAVLKL